MIEGKTEVERNGRPQNVAVAHNRDVTRGPSLGNALKKCDHTILRFEHQLAAGDAGDGAPGIEDGPAWIRAEGFERLARPLAEVDLEQLVSVFDIAVDALRERGCRLARALERAGKHRIESKCSNTLREGSQLGAASVVEALPGGASGEIAAESIDGTMANEKKRRHDKPVRGE